MVAAVGCAWRVVVMNKMAMSVKMGFMACLIFFGLIIEDVFYAFGDPLSLNTQRKGGKKCATAWGFKCTSVFLRAKATLASPCRSHTTTSRSTRHPAHTSPPHQLHNGPPHREVRFTFLFYSPSFRKGLGVGALGRVSYVFPIYGDEI